MSPTGLHERGGLLKAASAPQGPWSTVVRDRGLLVFAALVALQTGHIAEHLIQLFQIYVLGHSPAHSHGLIGMLDIEWVHFVWNLGTLAAVSYLVMRYRANHWLWLAFFLAVWHQIEHVYVFTVYLTTGVAGDPGLLAKGGAIFGGLPFTRPVLHALYNIVETLPMAVGLVHQLRAERQVTAAVRP